MRTPHVVAVAVLLFNCPASAYPRLSKGLMGSTFVVSTQPITESSSTNTVAPTQTFRLQQPLTVRVFYPESLSKALRLTGTDYKINVWEHFLCGRGSEYQRVKIWIPKSDFDKNYLDLEVVPDPQRARTKYDEGNYQTLIGWAGWDSTAKCVKTANKLIISLLRGTSGQVELPPITIDFSDANLPKLKKLSNDVAALGDAAFSRHLALATAGMRDARLEKQLVALWKRNDKDVKKARAVIISTGWNVETDAARRPLSRTLDVSMVSQKKNGKCFSMSVGVNEPARGRGFGAPTFASTGGTEHQIDCGKAFGARGK
jgi:hypothetical protein